MPRITILSKVLYVFYRKLHGTLLELDKVASGCVDKSEIMASLRFISSIVRNRYA